MHCKVENEMLRQPCYVSMFGACLPEMFGKMQYWLLGKEMYKGVGGIKGVCGLGAG